MAWITLHCGERPIEIVAKAIVALEPDPAPPRDHTGRTVVHMLSGARFYVEESVAHIRRGINDLRERPVRQ